MDSTGQQMQERWQGSQKKVRQLEGTGEGFQQSEMEKELRAFCHIAG